VYEAKPQLRNVSKELASFMPSALMHKQAQKARTEKSKLEKAIQIAAFNNDSASEQGDTRQPSPPRPAIIRGPSSKPKEPKAISALASIMQVYSDSEEDE
jgi:hypothetical protein